MSLIRILPATLSLALLLSACGASHPALGPTRPIGGGGVHAQALKAGDIAIEGPVKALAALEYAHAAARAADPKAAFVSLTGSRISPAGTPESGGEWRVDYFGSAIPGREPQNPYGNKTYRRLTVVIASDGQATLTTAEQVGMPLGVCYMDSPLPALDSGEILKAARRARPGDFQLAVEKMVLAAQLSPQHQPRLVWKVASLSQGIDRPLAIDANTGEPIAPAAH